MSLWNEILDWSEVWAPLIPLTIYVCFRPKYVWVKPVLWYLVLALFFSIMIDAIYKQYDLGLNKWFDRNFSQWYTKDGYLKNTIFYNFISISRLLFFSWFFHYMGNPFKKMNSFIPVSFIGLTLINFIFFDDITDFSSRLITLETAILLMYCVIYFFKVLRDEKPESPETRPAFWVVTGLSIYVSINFFIFLFFRQLTMSFEKFAQLIWPFHNISNILLCVCIAIAFRKK